MNNPTATPENATNNQNNNANPTNEQKNAAPQSTPAKTRGDEQNAAIDTQEEDTDTQAA